MPDPTCGGETQRASVADRYAAGTTVEILDVGRFRAEGLQKRRPLGEKYVLQSFRNGATAYGFTTKATRGGKRVEFSHPLFLRGRWAVRALISSLRPPPPPGGANKA